MVPTGKARPHAQTADRATRQRREARLSRRRPVPAADLPQAPSARADVEALCSGWRAALDAEATALHAARGSLPPEELAARRRRLDAERESTLGLLKALARDRGFEGRFVHLTPRWAARRALGLPAAVQACVFNLDGVLIGSASLHAAAWMEALDEFIWARTERTGGRFAPFSPRVDYPRHMHGRPRLDGVRAFLASRGIALPEGSPTDPAGAETVHGLARRKNEALRRQIDARGVTAYEGAYAYLQLAGEAGLVRAAVSASANTRTILEVSGLAPLVDVCVDGNTMVERGLRAKPAPDPVLVACELLGVEPAVAAAFEATEAGVVAARGAGCAVVVGIDQFGQAGALLRSGASPVVPGLAELLDQRLAA